MSTILLTEHCFITLALLALFLPHGICGRIRSAPSGDGCAEGGIGAVARGIDFLPSRSPSPLRVTSRRYPMIPAISLSEKATIHCEDMASDHGCSWTCQKENRGGYFVRLGKAA
jgi:hypothetical protein